MTEHLWFYVRDGRREGPVRRARLLELARGGWLAPTDLVWTEGRPEWVPAGSEEWLFGSAVARALHGMFDGTVHPATPPRRSPHRGRSMRRVLVDWDRVEPRQVAGVAGLVACALGVAFLAIASTRLAWWLCLGGAFVAAAGFHRESAPWLVGLARLIARATTSAAGTPSDTAPSEGTPSPAPRRARKNAPRSRSPRKGAEDASTTNQRRRRSRRRRRGRRGDHAPPGGGADRGSRDGSE